MSAEVKFGLTVPEVLPIARAYVRRPGNGAGGSLHIVLDDLNVETCHVEFCREYAMKEGDWDGAALADILLSMTRTQRSKIARLCYRAPTPAPQSPTNG